MQTEVDTGSWLQALEAMLKGEKVRTDKRKKSARDAGAWILRLANLGMCRNPVL